MNRIPAPLRAAVRTRGNDCCEYCLIPDLGTFFSHQPDHIIASQHGGQTVLENLALACIQCNRQKGPNIASVDPETNRTVPLFNPRVDRWVDHFRIEGARIIGLTPVGRATTALLQFGHSDREEARRNCRPPVTIRHAQSFDRLGGEPFATDFRHLATGIAGMLPKRRVNARLNCGGIQWQTQFNGRSESHATRSWLMNLALLLLLCLCVVLALCHPHLHLAGSAVGVGEVGDGGHFEGR